jgi:hypothetical protein
LLEDDIIRRFATIGNAGLKVLLQDLGIEFPIHPSITLDHIASSFHNMYPKPL